jgi:prevent-host-death family protein
MSELATATDTLSHFQQNTAEWMDRLKATGEPVVLTCHGKDELVVQDAAAYRRMAEWAKKAEMHDFMKRSIADADAGRTRPMREAIEALGRKDAVQG